MSFTFQYHDIKIKNRSAPGNKNEDICIYAWYLTFCGAVWKQGTQHKMGKRSSLYKILTLVSAAAAVQSLQHEPCLFQVNGKEKSGTFTRSTFYPKPFIQCCNEFLCNCQTKSAAFAVVGWIAHKESVKDPCLIFLANPASVVSHTHGQVFCVWGYV